MLAHTKIAALILGGILLFWSTLALGPDESLFVMALEHSGYALEWSAIMFCNGLLLLLGALIPWRSGRHIGLALGCFTFTALGGLFFLDGVVTPVTVTMPYLGIMSLITFLAEAKGKPRDGRT